MIMTLITCKNGHRYDPSLTSECPECAMLRNHTVPLETADDNGPAQFDVLDIPGTVELDRNEVEEKAAGPQVVHAEVNMDRMHTQAVDYSGNYIDRSALAIAGWLVCIEGPEKGKDYRLHSENNFIGRGAKMDVRITADRTVSEDRHAVITYDPQENKFFFALSGGASIVRLNGKAVLMTQEIKQGDHLQIGQGTFLFIPLCGENFKWED